MKLAPDGTPIYAIHTPRCSVDGIACYFLQESCPGEMYKARSCSRPDSANLECSAAFWTDNSIIWLTQTEYAAAVLQGLPSGESHDLLT